MKAIIKNFKTLLLTAMMFCFADASAQLVIRNYPAYYDNQYEINSLMNDVFNSKGYYGYQIRAHTAKDFYQDPRGRGWTCTTYVDNKYNFPLKFEQTYNAAKNTLTCICWIDNGSGYDMVFTYFVRQYQDYWNQGMELDVYANGSRKYVKGNLEDFDCLSW